MRTLMLADRAFATREHAMLRRVEVGLIDDGVRLIRAIPEGIDDIETSPLVSTVRYRDRANALTAGAYAAQLMRTLQSLDPPLAQENETDLLDTVHAWGDDAWLVALRVASAASAGLAIELWSLSSVRAMRAFERKAASIGPDAPPIVWLAPNARIAESARQQRPAWPVQEAFWGVHSETQHHPRHDPEAPLGVSIISSGQDQAALIALLDALADTTANGRETLIFLDDAGVKHRPAVWKHAERLGLLERLSIIAGMESRRDLVLDTDVLILPESLGEVRSITLDAMAAGMLVVARADPHVEVTSVRGVALLVDGPSATSWRTALSRVFAGDDADGIATLRSAARERIVMDRPVHRQVECVLGAYRTLTDNPSIEFPVAH